MRVFLTGFMGAGKSTVGRLLADRIGVPFLDLDAEIERRAQQTVATIFAREGEIVFRQLEYEALQAVLQQPKAVVATGGGTPTSERNRDLMSQGGTSLWLDVPFSVIVERIGVSGREERPLFKDQEQARRLYKSRLGSYRQADLSVVVSREERSKDVAERIFEALGGVTCAI